MKKIKIAFTLAEVLITLAIIGIVAALTIPSVVANYQKKQTVTQLKKTFSALANTTNMAIADNGPVLGWEVETLNDETFSDRYLKPYLKIAKDIKTNGVDGHSSNYFLNTPYDKFILSDGTIVSVNAYSDDKAKSAFVYIDLNGIKAPNKVGKDIFVLIYRLVFKGEVRGKFEPYGMDYCKEATGDKRNCWKNYSTAGCSKEKPRLFCAGLIMFDNWKIKDDYPW